ncbi:hypothetical protein F4818DRAFT_414881 [Hypoxylon cercidicola]|nr:hypothetical protein F4818DRAFT_414881 [Hypoxylon cercidicola]
MRIYFFVRPRVAMPEPSSIAESPSTATSTPTAAIQHAISSASSDPAMSSGLTIGMLVGIGIVASLCALGLGVLAMYLLRRFRKRGTKKNNHYVGMPPAQYPGFQLQRGYTQTGSLSHSTTKSNKPKGSATTVRTPVPQELPASPAAVELPSYWHRYR